MATMPALRDKLCRVNYSIQSLEKPPCRLLFDIVVWLSVKERHMQYATLKQRHRQERDSQPVNLSLRLHRALSWLNRAEQVEDDDGRFIFLWIAFNAAYATEIDERYRLSEQATSGNS